MLQLVEMLLAKLPADYKPAFRREGVVFELQTLAARPIASKEKDKDKTSDKDKEKESGADGERAPSPAAPVLSAAMAASIPGYRKLASMSIDPEDAITLRARIVLFRYLSEGSDNSSDGDLDVLVAIAHGLGQRQADEQQLGSSLKSLITCFAKGESAISSFELLQSGVVDALMLFATAKDYVGETNYLTV
jgi:E3 ubiquitin-protein ligase TRIP12